jgi:hypothetical protein
MKRALAWALLAGFAAGLVLYLVNLALDRRATRWYADGSRGSLRARDESFLREGRGRVDEILPTGVYPSSAEGVPSSARAQGMASWGQGPRGATGYEDSGESELSGLQ